MRQTEFLRKGYNTMKESMDDICAMLENESVKEISVSLADYVVEGGGRRG